MELELDIPGKQFGDSFGRMMVDTTASTVIDVCFLEHPCEDLLLAHQSPVCPYGFDDITADNGLDFCPFGRDVGTLMIKIRRRFATA